MLLQADGLGAAWLGGTVAGRLAGWHVAGFCSRSRGRRVVWSVGPLHSTVLVPAFFPNETQAYWRIPLDCHQSDACGRPQSPSAVWWPIGLS